MDGKVERACEVSRPRTIDTDPCIDPAFALTLL